MVLPTVPVNALLPVAWAEHVHVRVSFNTVSSEDNSAMVATRLPKS